MENPALNWEEIYASLKIESLKQSGKWMFAATLVAGIIIVGIFSLFFRKFPVAIIIMAAGALMFSAKYGLGVWRLGKNPKVYTGILIGKIENSHKQEATSVRYISYQLRLNVETACELSAAGLGEIKKYVQKRIKTKCTKEIFNAITENERITVVVMPHDNTVAWFKKNEL